MRRSGASQGSKVLIAPGGLSALANRAGSEGAVATLRAVIATHDARGWWLAQAGPVEARGPLDSDVTADRVIVGGGYTGMWTAWLVHELAPDA